MHKQGFIADSLRFRQDLRRFFVGWLRPKILEAEEERELVNSMLSAHWAPQPIRAYELLFERWEDGKEPASGNKHPKDGSFVVFIDFEFDVDWVTQIDIDPQSAKCISAAEAIGARRCKHLPFEQVLELKRIVGQAIISAIRNDAAECSKSVAAATQFLKDRTVERSRYWTLISAHIFVLLFSAVLAGVFLWSELWNPDDDAWKILLWASMHGGLLGAYLSIIQSAGNGQWDAAAGRKLHALEVITKLSTGTLFGGIAFSLVKSVQSPSALKQLVSDGTSMFIFGFASGFIERLVPKMISSYSEITLNDKK